MKSTIVHSDIQDIYLRLDALYSLDNWWQAESKLEVILGSILTQNTSWKNVEHSISNIKSAHAMNMNKLINMDTRSIRRLISPSGFYNQKTNTIKGILIAIKNKYGNIENMSKINTEELHEFLLNLKGIGNETADSILLYAFNKPVFVIDAYTKRIMSRIYGINQKIEYNDLQGIFVDSLQCNPKFYKQMHAYFVELAKNNCTKNNPKCNGCVLNSICNHANLQKNNYS
jgi:endonuclease-3 related protein